MLSLRSGSAVTFTKPQYPSAQRSPSSGTPWSVKTIPDGRLAHEKPPRHQDCLDNHRKHLELGPVLLRGITWNFLYRIGRAPFTLRFTDTVA